MWCIEKITPQFRKLMYGILDLYEEPYNSQKPVIGLDEKPKQLIEDSRTPIPIKPGKIAKQDYEYIRRGKANIFMAVEPKGGKRFTEVTWQRTKKDFAFFVKGLIRKYPKAKIIRLVVDNLNTHNESSFYETFEREKQSKIDAISNRLNGQIEKNQEKLDKIEGDIVNSDKILQSKINEVALADIKLEQINQIYIQKTNEIEVVDKKLERKNIDFDIMQAKYLEVSTKLANCKKI